MSSGDDWIEWKRHVLAELKRHSEQQDAILSEMNTLVTKVSVLETKAMILGAVFGGLVSLVGHSISHFWR